jgi:hypothetical protein
MVYYFTVERNKPLSHEKMGKKLKCILLNERSKPPKATYYMAFYHMAFWKT